MNSSDTLVKSFWFNASAWMLCALIIAGCVVRPITPEETTPQDTTPDATVLPTVTPAADEAAPAEVISPTVATTTTVTTPVTATAETITDTAGITGTAAMTEPADITGTAPITPVTALTSTEPLTPTAPITPTESVTPTEPLTPAVPVTATANITGPIGPTATAATTATATTTVAPTTTAAVTVTAGVSTIVEIIQTTPGLERLAEAMLAAGMNDALSLPGPFTFFAPNNDAFDALTPEQLDALITSPTALVNMINYHTVIDLVSAAQLTALGSALASSGQAISITLAPEGGIAVNDARIVQPDIVASNGVIHIIDGILTPPTP
jgi:uncharacterized surface protein with fasciclin (FAS1) repeats